MTSLLGSFAMLALVMSTLGVYTVVSYLTARRTKEVALRRAIGATPARRASVARCADLAVDRDWLSSRVSSRRSARRVC